MIFLAHGQFDHVTQPTSGIEVMAERFREFHHPVKTIEHDGGIDAADIEDRQQLFGFVGFSKGAERALRIIQQLADETLVTASLVVLIDGVADGQGDLPDLPSNIVQCVTYVRESRFNPSMATWAANQEVISVPTPLPGFLDVLDHGALPDMVMDEVVERFRKLFASPPLPTMGQT